MATKFYVDNAGTSYYVDNVGTSYYVSRDDAPTAPTAQEIVDLLLGTDLVAFVGDPNSFGAYIRDQLLTVHKFLGLQHVPTLPPVESPPE